jgi:hypothetical protein
MELLSAVRAVAVPDHPEVLEHVERPVDGGWDRVRIACATPLDEVGAGHVTVDLRQHLNEDPPLRRPPQPRARSCSGIAVHGRATVGPGHGRE